jgi:dihydrofolate synthase/folylpolyglutamate synthase
VSDAEIAEGLRTVIWPARIQPLKGKLRDRLPDSSELWLDGAHNAHGAAALALSLEEMNAARPKPLVLILGMINTREPRDFLEPFKGLNPRVLTLTIPGEANAHKATYVAAEARKAGLEAQPFRALGQAIDAAAALEGARVVIGGSLYLAGYALDKNGTPPD